MKKILLLPIIALIAAIIVLAVVLVIGNSYKTADKCDFTSKNYIGKSVKECSLIQFLCAEGQRFDDKCGCGCILLNKELEKTFCSAESRNADACIALYDPVCGWFAPAKIQCIKYPCAQTFSNSCFACMDENVLYFTKGECPQ